MISLEFVPEARNECRVRIGSLSEQVVWHVPFRVEDECQKDEEQKEQEKK